MKESKMTKQDFELCIYHMGLMFFAIKILIDVAVNK